MTRHGYPQLFQQDGAWLHRATQLASKTYEWSEYLGQQLEVTGFAGTYTGTIAYHPSCQLTHGLKLWEPAQQLLGTSFPEQVIHTLPESCCGFGGTFAVDHPELSIAMVDRKIEQIEACGAEMVTGCDVSCLMQIEGRLRRLGSRVRTAHMAQLLCGMAPGLD